MLRSFFVVLVGVVFWSVLWLGYNALLTTLGLLPADSASPVQTPTPLLLLLAGSILCSLATGYVTTALARDPRRIYPLVLGLLLLGIGILVQTQFWQLMPLWYHFLFLALLIPATVLGGAMYQRADHKLEQGALE